MAPFKFKFAIISLLLIPSICMAISLQVNISGLSAPLAKIVRADLHLQDAIIEPKLSPERIQNLYDLAPEQISATLQSQGFYNSQITSDLKKISAANPENDTWIANFNILPGKPTILKSVKITVVGQGEKDRRIAPLLVSPKLIIGKILLHENYEDTKDKLLADINSVGYLQAEFKQSTIEVNRATNQAMVTFEIETGVLYVFGKVTFIESLYPDVLLNRYLPFHPGDPYDLNKLAQFQENLEQADLFNKIRFDPITNLDDPSDNVVPINVRLTPKPRNRYTFSVGYGTDTSFRGSAGWLHRRVDSPGDIVNAYIGASKILRQAKITYSIPGKQPATDKYLIGINAQEEFVDELYSRKADLAASKIFKRGKLETIYGVNFFSETFHLTSSVPNQTKNYLLPCAKWIWVDKNEKDDYDYGTRVDLTIRAGLKAILSSTSVLQTEFNVKQIWPIYKLYSSRFLFRGNIGTVTSEDFANLPPTLRYFTGGDYTVRGYAYNTIGPRAIPGDPYSENVGGKYLLVLSGEYEQHIYQKLSGVIFLDAGNASNNFGGPLAMGAGFGVRYATPIGLIRFDLAKPLNTVINKHWRIHFNFGTDL